MADNGGGGGAGMGVLVGALLVAVLVLGFFVFTGGNFMGTKHVDVHVSAPQLASGSPAAPTSK